MTRRRGHWLWEFTGTEKGASLFASGQAQAFPWGQGAIVVLRMPMWMEQEAEELALVIRAGTPVMDVGGHLQELP